MSDDFHHDSDDVGTDTAAVADGVGDGDIWSVFLSWIYKDCGSVWWYRLMTLHSDGDFIVLPVPPHRPDLGLLRVQENAWHCVG